MHSDHSQLTKTRERIACICFIAATCYPSVAIFFSSCTSLSRDDCKSCKFVSKIAKPRRMETPLNRLNLKSPVCIFVTLPLQRDSTVARLNRWNCICAAPIQREGTTCVVFRCMQQRTYIRAIRYGTWQSPGWYNLASTQSAKQYRHTPDLRDTWTIMTDVTWRDVTKCATCTVIRLRDSFERVFTEIYNRNTG